MQYVKCIFVLRTSNLRQLIFLLVSTEKKKDTPVDLKVLIGNADEFAEAGYVCYLTISVSKFFASLIGRIHVT
jgi:hypothetical protein